MPVQAVAIVVYEGVQTLDVAGPMVCSARRTRSSTVPIATKPILVAAHRDPIRASNGMRLVADLTLEEAAGCFDIILVAGAPVRAGLDSVGQGVALALEPYGSICTGAFVLSYAGLLDDR